MHIHKCIAVRVAVRVVVCVAVCVALLSHTHACLQSVLCTGTQRGADA